MPKAASGTGPEPVTQPVDQQWDDGTTMDEATVAGAPPSDSFGSPEEMTVEEQRPGPARLIVIAGNDTGREFTLTPPDAGKALTIGRAIENDVVLTDIAVSRKHLDVLFDGAHWVLKDRGSGNGTLVNDRIEDGACRLQHGDRIEIGHTVFKFDHVASQSAGAALGFGAQNEDEASTVAGRQPSRPSLKAPASLAPPPGAPSPVRRTVLSPAVPPPVNVPRATLPPPRPRTSSQPPPNISGMSSRLALPPNPSTGIEDIPPPAEPALLSVAPLATTSPVIVRPSLQMQALGLERSMTATAHVDPLPYSSGSMPPVDAYPTFVPPMPRKQLLAWIGAALAAATVIGVIASVTGDNEKPPAAAPTSAMRVAAPDAVPDVTPKPTPDPANDTPEPVADVAPPPPAPVDAVAARDSASAAAPAVVVPVPPPTADEPTAVEPAPAPAVVEPPKPVERLKTVEPPRPPRRVERKVEREPRKVVRPEKADRIDKPEKSKPATSVASARKKAQSLYASKSFKSAAEAARAGADAATDATDAAELRKLASDYDALASAMAAGDASATSRATEALTAFKRALAIDKRLGGTHAAAIRERLAQVAPKAAAGFMAKGNYEAAKQAADTAVNFGAGSSPTVAQVRQSLERKAGEFYSNGQKLMSTKPEEGKALLRRVQKIVPADSPWYTKAYQALNKRAPARDDDE